MIPPKRLRFNTLVTTKLKQLFIALVALFFICNANAQETAIIKGTVSDQFGSLPGAKVIIVNQSQKENKSIVTADVNGTYTLDVIPGSYTISTEFIMYIPVSESLTIKEGETKTVNLLLKPGFSIDQPISLGSRSVPNSSLKNTSAVDIISPSKITNSSQIELSQLLHYLIPSFHSTHQTIADGTDHIDPATLRGLGPDQVLVLVNGKRRHSSSLLNVNGTIGRGSVGTDFNAIPIASVERIEVLRDGAASQYGSDAIAGVINIVLKKQTQVISLDNRTGITESGDGFYVYSGANFGLKIGKKGYINVTAEYRDRDAVNRAGDYKGAVYTENRENDLNSIAKYNFFGQTGYSGKRVMEIGSAATQNLGLMFNGEIEMSNDATFYLHGGRNYREGKSKGFYRFPIKESSVVRELFFNGFSPEILTDIQDNAATIGVKGVRNQWDVDFSHSIGTNGLDYTVNNSNNASLGITSPRTFYAGGFMYRQNITNLDAYRSYDWLHGTNVAFGGALRVENYQIIAGEEASYVNGGATYIGENGEEIPKAVGSQVFPGFRPENELNRFRTNISAYIDVESNITEDLLLKAAARYDYYNNFGGETIWKLSGRYSFNENFSGRMGLSTGFRAPSLHQLFFQNISTQFLSGESIQVGTFNSESAVVNDALGAGELKPELSKNFSLGISGKVFKNFTFGLDYYYIEIKDRIVLSGKLGKGFEQVFEPFGINSLQFFTNAIDSRTSGLEGNFEFKKTIKKGILNTSLGFNYTNTRVDRDIKYPKSLAGNVEMLFNREEIARLEFAQPQFKVNALVSYDLDKFRCQLNNTIFGSVKYLHPSDGDINNWKLNEFTGIKESRDQTFSPKIVTDAEVSFQLTDFIRFSAGGNNIFNVFPDRHKHSANTNDGNFIYSRRVQQFGVAGAYYYLKLLLNL